MGTIFIQCEGYSCFGKERTNQRKEGIGEGCPGKVMLEVILKNVKESNELTPYGIKDHSKPQPFNLLLKSTKYVDYPCHFL